MADTDSRLSEDQRARVAALRAARTVIQRDGGDEPDSVDLVALARFILDGGDPFDSVTPNDESVSLPMLSGEVAVVPRHLERVPDPPEGEQP